MGDIVKMNLVSLMIMPNGKIGGKGSVLDVMSISNHGFTGKTDNTVPGDGQTYGRDVHGRIRIKTTFEDTPGGLITGTFEFDREQQVDFLELRRADQQKFAVWEYYIPCGRLDNRAGWRRLDYHGRMRVTGRSQGDAPSREGSAEPVVDNIPSSWEYDIILNPLALTNIQPTAANAEDLNSITMLTDPNPDNCVPGYRGPDKHLYVAAQAGAAAIAEVYGTRDGGSTWTATSAFPFPANDHIVGIESNIMTGPVFRLMAANGVVTTADGAEIAHADVSFGDEFTSVWSIVKVTAVASELCKTLYWPFLQRGYVSVGVSGSEGQIFITTDSGVSWTQAATGTDPINVFTKGFGADCRDVYAGGDNGRLLIERNYGGSFDALVSPNSNDITALAVANDGLLFAGIGTELHVSVNNGLNAGGWSLVRDFGANKAITNIFLKKGDSNLIKVVVDDTTGSVTGRLHSSHDGGNDFELVEDLPNLGYNDAVTSLEDDNAYWLCGDVDAGSLGVVQKAIPNLSGC